MELNSLVFVSIRHASELCLRSYTWDCFLILNKLLTDCLACSDKRQGPSACTAATPNLLLADIVRQFAGDNPSTDVSKALALEHTPRAKNTVLVWVQQRTPKSTGSSLCALSQDVDGHKSPYHRAPNHILWNVVALDLFSDAAWKTPHKMEVSSVQCKTHL